jgi:hypothetical protein
MSFMTLDLPSGRAPSDSLWLRFRHFIQEARQRKADEVIMRNLHLLPVDLERAGFGMNSRNEHTLPFRR